MFGCGRMGSALLSQWLSTRAWPYGVSIVKPTLELPQSVRTYSNITCYTSLEDVPRSVHPTMVVLGVKPQQLSDVLADSSLSYGTAPCYLTMAAGKTMDFYTRLLGEEARIIRVMPNTPSLIGLGMSTLCAAKNTTEEECETAEALMKAVGEILWLDSEKLIDTTTAIAGSGPAYVFYFMECMISAAIEAGLDEKTARLLVVQTLHGSSELAYLSGESLAQLRENVTSKGGTTQAALECLMQPSGLLRLMHEAVDAGLKRAKELADE
jgi:pyrroline-5-carboxylate reductase